MASETVTTPSPSTPIPPAVADKALAWVISLHSGELGPKEREALSAWRAADTLHELAWRQAIDRWFDKGLELNLVDKARSASQHQAGKYRAVAVEAADASSSPAEAPVRSWRNRRKLLAAGGIGIIAALGLGLMIAGPSLSADYATGIGSTRLVTLPDGSVVTLGPDSQLDIAFSPGERRIVLRRGEAFFQVAADPASRPFQVGIGQVQVEVEAPGTRFNISRQLDGRVSAAVAANAARVDWTGADLSSTLLAAGNELLVDVQGGMSPPEPVPAAEVGSWQRGELTAHNMRLGDVIAMLRRYHYGWIRLPDADLAQRLVTAMLNPVDLDQSLAALAKAVPLQVRRPLPLLVVIDPSGS